MAFSLMNGLSTAGTAVAATAGAYTLEAQKAEAETAKIQLADELAGKRQDKQNVFASEESGKERGSREKISGETNATHIEAAKIGLQGSLASAGATLEGARIHANSVEKQINAENSRASVIQMNDDGTSSLVNKVTGKVEPLVGPDGQPMKFRDPDLAKAQLEAVRTTSTQLADLQRKYQTDVTGPRQSMLQAQKDPMLFGPEKAKAIAEARAEVERVEKLYAPDFLRLNSRLDTLAESLGTKAKITPTTGTRPPLSDFNKTPAVTGAPAPGLINSPAAREE